MPRVKKSQPDLFIERILIYLMEEKKYNFSEIAEQAGFNSLSYFTRSFKDFYGKTPSEYMDGSKISKVVRVLQTY
ncbi:MAG TPA: helix-turn-helix domain-containing protein [Ohtaekwangia sp.]